MISETTRTIDQIKRDIIELAENPADENLRAKIWENLYSLIPKEYSGSNTCIVFLVNVTIYNTEWYDICGVFNDVIMKLISPEGFKSYCPDKSKFFGYFLQSLHNALIDYSKKNEKRYETEVSGDDPIDEDSDETLIDLIKSKDPTPEEIVVNQESFAEIIKILTDKFHHQTIKRCEYFGATFTFDVAKVVKQDLKVAEIVKKEPKNTGLFRHMVQKVLTFLMIGEFSGMRDIVDNEVRGYVNWDNRQGTIKKCYNKKNLNEHFQAYDELRKAVWREYDTCNL